MNLRREQKAERRARILGTARVLVAERGFGGLTMRDLAREARVTVPTIYNLIGGKEAVLLAAVEEQTARFVAGIEAAPRATPAARVLAVVGATADELLRMPRYYRSLLRVLLGSDAAGPARGVVARALTSAFRGAISDMRDAGELAAWIEPQVLAERMTSYTNVIALEWAAGQMDDAGLRDAALYGCAMMLLGVAEGASREALAAGAARAQAGAASPRRDPAAARDRERSTA